MKRLYLLLLSGLLLASCVKEELPQPSEGEVLDAKLAQMGQPRIVLEPPHQYVCFSPTDSAQVANWNH